MLVILFYNNDHSVRCQFLNTKDVIILSKKSLIIEQAALLFAEHSIESTSIEHITKTCGISKGAFYLHFKSKDDLILQIFDHFFKDIAGRFAAIEHGSLPAEKKLRTYVITFFEMLDDKLSFISMYMRQQRTPNEDLFALFTHYNTLIDEATQQLLISVYQQKIKGVTTDVLVTLKGLIRGYSEHILLHRTTYNYELLADTIVERLNTIIEHATLWFLEDDMQSLVLCEVISYELISKEITTQLETFQEDALLVESLQLLQLELEKAKPSQAILKGMLANIKEETSLQWLCFLVTNYLKST